MSILKEKHSTLDEKSPVFKTWRSWYLLVVIVNVIIISLVAFLFSII